MQQMCLRGLKAKWAISDVTGSHRTWWETTDSRAMLRNLLECGVLWRNRWILCVMEENGSFDLIKRSRTWWIVAEWSRML